MMFKSCTSTKIACYTGYVVQAISNNFLPLLFVVFMDDFSLTYSEIGILVLIGFASQFVVDILAVRLCALLGYRYTVMLAHICCTLGFVLLSFLPFTIPPFAGLTVSVLVYATGSGLIEVIVSPIMEYLPTENKSGNMSLLHSFYCWGTVATVLTAAFLFNLLGTAKWGTVALLFALIPLINTFVFYKVPIFEPEPQEKSGTKKMLFSFDFFIFAVLMVTAGAAEIGVAEWVSAFMEQAVGFDKTVGDIVGPCFFAVCMGIGRVVFSFFGDRLDLKKVLAVLSVICFIAYLTLGISDIPLISVISCGVIGLCVSLMWPGVYSIASLTFPDGNAPMFGFLAMFGDIGCSLGPSVMGFIASAANLKTGFTVNSVSPLLMALALLYLLKNKKQARGRSK